MLACSIKLLNMEAWSEDSLNRSDESHYRYLGNKGLPLGFVAGGKSDVSDESSRQFTSRNGTANSSSNTSEKFRVYKDKAMGVKKTVPVKEQETKCFSCLII